MTTWTERDPVESAYLNPALVGWAIWHAARTYQQSRDVPMDWTLTFVIVPLVFHLPTRERLPSSSRTHLSDWLWRNPLTRARMPERVAAYADRTREGLRTGVRSGWYSLEDGRVLTTRNATLIPDLRPIAQAAKRSAKLLLNVREASTVYSLLGVRKIA